MATANILWKSGNILGISVPMASNSRWARFGCTFRHQQFQGSVFFYSLRSNCSSSSANSVSKGKEYLVSSDEELIRQCEMTTFKASGPGGQHRNKRESAVRLKHIPTGITAQVLYLSDTYSQVQYYTSVSFALKLTFWPFIFQGCRGSITAQESCECLSSPSCSLGPKT